jgi:hypothetical protein
LAAVPDPRHALLALVADPAHIAKVTPAEAAAMLAELAALQVALAARAVATARAPSEEPYTEDRLLTAEQVAARYSRSVEWVYRRARTSAWAAFTRREGRKTVRFSERGLLRHLAGKRT